jgi:DNA gyrase subunit A
MAELAQEVHPVNIEDELKQSYLDYAMSVIVGRALPDVRDGLKPVHRRVLYAMHELGNDWNKPYKKSARIVGDVIGKYHPHGDSAVYDAIVRMAQPFSMRYVLVDGQGNFGSIDGDAAAAMRYTEVRMSKLAHALLSDLDKETVDFVPNYDGHEMMPWVLPSRVPNLLVNGTSGIAVGMATNIPPHNLGEIISACLALIKDPSLGIEGLMAHVPGPDFPTKAMINGRLGIIEAYKTGRGRIYVRARTNIEIDERTDKASIIISELPYQVNKARLVEKIAELVKDKKIEGITGLRDESDKDGMRVVVELRRGEMPEVILNNLYTQTPMESVFGINMVALVDGQPRTLNLKEILEAFIDHRRVVVNRRTVFELRKARERAHVLEGLAVALVNLDPVIQLIKGSANPEQAKQGLVETKWRPGSVLEMIGRSGSGASRPETLGSEFGLVDGYYRLSPQQAQAILDLRLHRLTGLEQEKIVKEYQDLLEEIRALNHILSDQNRLMEVIQEELIAVRAEFGDARKTEILAVHQDLNHEDLITAEARVVTLSNLGYVKAQALSVYAAQRRGGRGKQATAVKEEDFVTGLVIASTHDPIMCFSTRGKVYWLKVYEIPVGSRIAKGRPINNLLPLDEGETISAILPLKADTTAKYIVMATQQGTIKKVPIEEFSRPRSTGLIAVGLDAGDELVSVQTTDGACSIMLFTDAGKVVRFVEDAIRPMGRTARGVRGVRLGEGQKVISMIVVDPTCSVLTATENGFGKRTPIEDFPVKGRGGQGVIAIQTTDRNGKVVSAVQVAQADEVMLITNQGTLVRTKAEGISIVGRNTQGVTLINLSGDEKLAGLERIQEVAGLELEGSEDAEGLEDLSEDNTESDVSE